MLSAKVAHVLAWTQQKVKRATVASGGSTIADAFGAAFPVPLGRVDATSADQPVKIPAQSASPAEVKVRQGEGSNAKRALHLNMLYIYTYIYIYKHTYIYTHIYIYHIYIYIYI